MNNVKLMRIIKDNTERHLVSIRASGYIKSSSAKIPNKIIPIRYQTDEALASALSTVYAKPKEFFVVVEEAPLHVPAPKKKV
jgi:hypothetical protein